MITFEIFQNLFVVFNLVIILLIFHKIIKLNDCAKNIKLLNKNLDFIAEIHENQNLRKLRNFVELYSKLQSISKISESYYVSLFKYDFSKTYITLELLLSIKNGVEIVDKSPINKMPATSNLFNIEIMKSTGFCVMSIDKMKEIGPKLYSIINPYGIKNIWYKNIEKNGIILGYVSLLYKDDYELDEQQKEEITRISQETIDLF